MAVGGVGVNAASAQGSSGNPAKESIAGQEGKSGAAVADSNEISSNTNIINNDIQVDYYMSVGTLGNRSQPDDFMAHLLS